MMVVVAASLFAVAALVPIQAQRIETIVPNPNWAQLRPIWTLQGGSGRVGQEVDGLPSINADSINDWTMYYGGQGQWQVFVGNDTGALSTEPVWRFGGSPSLQHVVVGDFYGNGRKLIGFNRDASDGSNFWFTVWFFGYDSTGIADTPTVIYDPRSFCIKDAQAADLDNDGASELIVARACTYPELWIYKGGPNFQLDSPTVVIGDPDLIRGNIDFRFSIADIDGDHRLDLLTGGDYQSLSEVMKVYFGSPTSPWSWKQADRIIPRPVGSIGPQPLPFSLHDVNGDGIPDLAGNVHIGDVAHRGAYLWLSGKGRNARTRPFDSTDFDVFFPGEQYFIADNQFGPLNDSTGRLQMLPLMKAQSGAIYLASSGPDGPNKTIDAYGGNPNESVWNVTAPVGDVNGDGWPDVITGSSNYRLGAGIAIIYSGGPYIPNDDPTVSVQEVTVENHKNGLSLWPNPACEELNIAWRGDLKSIPARFEVHDINGRLVASGAVEPHAGAALWRCADVPAGAYLLTAFDLNGAVIATANVIRQ